MGEKRHHHAARSNSERYAAPRPKRQKPRDPTEISRDRIKVKNPHSPAMVRAREAEQ
jgi:hypothetical protein